MDINWEAEIAELLGRLTANQQQLLALLENKHDYLLHRDHQALAELVPEEEALCKELQACHQQRQHLLEQAEAAGLPSDSIESLTGALPYESANTLQPTVCKAIERCSLLRHQGIVQWVVVQRTLLHLSHLLEIIATGGQSQPTYRKDGVAENRGALMDQAV